MLVAAICDACHRPMLQQATNVQLQAGELIATTAGVQMRNNQSPESYNFCDQCISAVRAVIDQVLRQRAAQRQQPAQTRPSA